MTPARYEQVARLFHAALDLPAERRGGFLGTACAGDEDLRLEVESLLTAAETAGDFIQSPAMAVAAQHIAHEAGTLELTGRVGAYDVVSLIGRGGMGEVYLAHDTRLGRHVALKLLHPALTGHPDAVRRFGQEARAASSLNHPNIVTIYEIGELAERQFLAMELVKGRPLSELVGRPFPLETIADIGAQLARALAVAHASGIVHRDIKPDNIIVRPDGYVKLVDFGLAQLAPQVLVPSDGAARAASGAHTRTVLGTPLYMSPEQARGGVIAPASDVFSLGVVLFELATGTHPFATTAPHRRSDDRAAAVVPRLPQMPALEPLLLRMLHTLESERPQASEVADALTTMAVAAVHRPRSATPASRPVAPSHLPSQRTPLVGRVDEVVAITRRLLEPDVRLLTLTGAGGTGKTRLAVHVAATIAERFEGGVSFVDLAPISDPSLVPSTIARALGISQRRDQPLLLTVCDHLQERGLTLLLIDNFEQVADAATSVRELLDTCPDVTVLVTSRQALRISGEHECPVAPLPLPEPDVGLTPSALLACPSIALFVQRATAVRADFSLTTSNAPAVIDICRRLDGLPLAIELAAARCKILPPAELSGRLERRLELLTGGARDLPQRQQTLHRAIAWSYDLLTPAERTLFRRLSVFVGGFTLEAAEAVCNAREDLGVDILLGVTTLVDNSLVVRPVPDEAVARCSMLETFRWYARDLLLQSGEADDVARAHAAYALVLAEDVPGVLSPPERDPWLRTCEAEHDNIRAAFRYVIRAGNVDWALRLGAAVFRFWEQRELAAEGREVLARVLALPGAERPTARRARALYGASVLADMQEDLGAAEALSKEACAIYRQLGDMRGVATTMSAMAWQAQHGGRHAEAVALHAETVALWQRLGEPTAVQLARFSMASAARAQGELDLARGILAELLPSCEARGDLRGVAAALNGLGDIALLQADYEAARDLHRRSLSAFQHIDDRWGIAQVLSDIADIELQAGRYADAWGPLLDSASTFRELGYQRGVARQLERLAWCAGCETRDEAAVMLASTAAAVRQRIGAPMKPVERARIDDTLASARARLDPEVYSRAWQDAPTRSLTAILDAARAFSSESPTGTSADPSGA